MDLVLDQYYTTMQIYMDLVLDQYYTTMQIYMDLVLDQYIFYCFSEAKCVIKAV